MFSIIVFSILTVLIAALSDRLLRLFWLERGKKLEWLNYESKKKSERLALIKRDNAASKSDLEQITALYDITKDICGTLSAEEMLAVFKDYASRFIGPGDYRLVHSREELESFPGYIALPLSIKRDVIGFLIGGGMPPSGADKFQILGGQLLVGLKRSYLYNKVQEMAITDSLTQTYTRRYFLERLDEEIDRSAKHKYEFSFLMLDIDHFKDINDRYGHLVGDAILKEAVTIIKDSVRQVDFIGRYGGEELAIVLPETGKSYARVAAERIRHSLSQKPVNIYDESLQITVSIGISAYPQDGIRSKELIEKADRALYSAKERGRNRVCVFEG